MTKPKVNRSTTKAKAKRAITRASTSKTSATTTSSPAADDSGPGHQGIAEESLAKGGWEAIVLDRKGDLLTLRFRDYPRLPKFFRHRTAVALMSPAADQ